MMWKSQGPGFEVFMITTWVSVGWAGQWHHGHSNTNIILTILNTLSHQKYHLLECSSRPLDQRRAMMAFCSGQYRRIVVITQNTKYTSVWWYLVWEGGCWEGSCNCQDFYHLLDKREKIKSSADSLLRGAQLYFLIFLPFTMLWVQSDTKLKFQNSTQSASSLFTAKSNHIPGSWRRGNWVSAGPRDQDK